MFDQVAGVGVLGVGYYKVKEAADGSSVAFTLEWDARWAIVANACYESGVNPTVVSAATSAGVAASSSSTTAMAFAAFAPADAGYVGFAFPCARCATNADLAVTNGPAGYTNRGSRTSFASGSSTPQIAALFTLEGLGSGSQTPGTGLWDRNVSAQVNGAFGLLINPVVATPPVAAFSATPTTGPAPLTVQFTDESTNDPEEWDWDFGDTGTSTDQHPEHEYTAPGSYDVGLEVTNAGGSDDELKVGYITVTEPGGPAGEGVEGFSVAFDDPTLEPDPTWTRLA
jgi:hypothetical protein